ncbi:hypothetical protein [Desulfobacter hydrogenophilus]|uniref:hypothetical protein n=1 Tax=Desulfobacter hydrogenophilus TaxID=2291 RepID=UPI003F669A1D
MNLIVIACLVICPLMMLFMMCGDGRRRCMGCTRVCRFPVVFPMFHGGLSSVGKSLLRPDMHGRAAESHAVHHAYM